MAVLCEAISVVIRTASLMRAFGDLETFVREVPNHTLAADHELARVGFMTPDDARSFVSRMSLNGLVYEHEGLAQDLVVVDQLRGPLVRCDWIEFGQITIEGHRVAAARLAGSSSSTLATPNGWTFEKSLSQTHGFVPTGEEAKSLKFLRRENGLDVYLNALTGEEVLVGRTSET